MSELRNRPPETVRTPDRPQPPDSPRQPERQPAADTRHTRDDVPRYDADAEFKHPVPKPDGYLPDDTGSTYGTAPAQNDLRQRADWTTRRGDPDLTARKDPAEAPALTEATDADRADSLRPQIDRPDSRDLSDEDSPDRYGAPLARPDGTRVPCYDGPPRREQTRQGWAGDCGIIAALGAVASHRPDDITRRIRPNEDGTYQVTLAETLMSGGVAEPTGREIELTVTPDLPVYDDVPATPACAQVSDGAAWCAIAEKAFAGVDQTWTAERRAAWAADWAGLCHSDQARNAEKPRSGEPATGYVRMHQGTTPWERAEALTQLTGQPAVVRELPHGPDEWKINRVIRTQLTDHKPVLTSSRREAYEGEALPHRLDAEHVYEVIGVEKGKILLRNPWNHKHPEPMETDEFAHNMSRYYSTLL